MFPPAFPVGTAAPVDRPSLTFPVGDRVITLEAMGPPDPEYPGKPNLLDWAEIQLLFVQQVLDLHKLARQALGKDSEDRRGILLQLIEADISMVSMCTQQEPEWVRKLTPPQRVEILKRQNALNGIDGHMEQFRDGLLGDSFAK